MFSSLSRRRVIALVVLTCLLLITLDRRGNAVIDRLRGVFATAMVPFETATEAVALPVERAWNGIARVDDLQRENEALRDQIEHMKGNDIEARSSVLEYRALLKLTRLTSKFSLSTLIAQVVGDSPSNFQNTVEINVGSIRGVEVGMPVTDGAGLVGRITQVFPTRSIVLLMTDPKFKISAQVLSTTEQLAEEGIIVPQTTAGTTSTSTPTTTTVPTASVPAVPGGATTSTSTTSTTSTSTTTTTVIDVVRETGTLQGQGTDKPLVLRFIDVDSSIVDVRVGAVVSTAGGFSALAPQGIPIGYVTAIERQTGSSTATVEVQPNASLRRLNFLAVVLYRPNSQAIGR